VHCACESVGRQPARHSIRGRKGPVHFVGLAASTRCRHTVLLELLPADPCLFIARVSHFSALNDRLEAAIDHAFAVEWHGIRLRLHAGIGHHLVPGRFARLLRWPDDPREYYSLVVLAEPPSETM
jgi:hypothetical protein